MVDAKTAASRRKTLGPTDAERAEASRKSEYEARIAAERLRNEAFKERDETRAQFAELKALIANLTDENARQRGYIERVREVEIASEDPVMAGQTTTYELAPRHRSRGNGMGGIVSAAEGRDGSARRHWSNY